MVTWKFPLELTDLQVVKMPNGARILTVQVQHDVPCLWALVDPEKTLVNRRIRIWATGQPILEDFGVYLGTIQLRDGSLVFHVCELQEP